jgi:lipoprotein NlpI
MTRVLLAALLAAIPMTHLAADDAKELLEKAGDAFKAGKFKDAADHAEKASKADAKSVDAPYLAGMAYSRLREHDSAIKAFTIALDRNPKFVIAQDRRGDARLKSGQWKDAIADFDAYLAVHPKDAPEHWRRGIALYYAGRFEDGVKQFDIHRTVNPEDVENSAWHYLCNARANSPKKAREDLIPVTKDARVPMKQVLELFAGKLKPQDVIDAAENSKLTGVALTSARFYAHQYVALYYESEKDDKKALEHIAIAAEKYKIGDYMWDVADAHLKMLQAKKK